MMFSCEEPQQVAAIYTHTHPENSATTNYNHSPRKYQLVTTLLPNFKLGSVIGLQQTAEDFVKMYTSFVFYYSRVVDSRW